MKFNLVLTGIVFGMVGGYFAGQLGSQKIVEFVDSQSSSIIAFCILAFAFVAITLLFSEKVIKALTSAKNTQLIAWFDSTAESLFEVLKIPESSAKKLVQPARDALAIYLSWRTRGILFGVLVAIVVVIVGSISTHVTIEQNRKLETQNFLIQEQNGAVRVQLLLAEAARYEVYADRAEEIAAGIANEAQISREDLRESLSRDGERYAPWTYAFVQLEQSTLDTITSVLELSDPYPVFDVEAITGSFESFNDLEVDFLSPERGRVLKSLLLERVYLDIARPMNFAGADMRHFSLPSPFHVDGYHLDGCDDPRTQLSWHTLERADFSGATINAVDFGRNSDFDASSTIFRNSSVMLPISSRRSQEIEDPGSLTFIDSNVTLDYGRTERPNEIPLKNVIFLVLEVREDGTNCAQFQFVYDQSGRPLVPAVSFLGSTLMTGGVDEFGNDARQSAFGILKELSAGGEVTVPFSAIVDVVMLLLIDPRTQDDADLIKNGLIEANSGVSVRVRSIAVPQNIVETGVSNIWSDGSGKFFTMEFL